MLKVKRAGKGKDKIKELSDKVLKSAIVDILKRVDFSTVSNFSTRLTTRGVWNKTKIGLEVCCKTSTQNCEWSSKSG